MNLNKIINELNSQSSDITQIHNKLVNEQTKTIAAIIGGTVGFTAVMLYKIHNQSK